MRDLIDTEDNDDSTYTFNDDHDTSFASSKCPSPHNDEDLHLDPAYGFKLWQVFLDRVNPLTKIIHVPTVQPYLVQALADLNSIPLPYQALVNAIYGSSAMALSEEECIQTIGAPRELAMQKFLRGTHKALVRLDFLRNYDMTVLQSLLLVLVELPHGLDRR